MIEDLVREVAAPAVTDNSVLVVLAAGAVTQDFVSVVNSTTPALLPYMGRPLIYQIVVNHIRRHGRDVVIALPDNEPRLEDFLRVTFGTRVNLVLARIRAGGNNAPVTSLLAALDEGLARGIDTESAFIVHGDIYFEPPPVTRNDRAVVFVDDYIESDKYSFFVQHDRSVSYVGPRELGSVLRTTDPVFTDIGAYWVPSLAVVRAACRDSVPRTVGGLLAQLYPKDLHLELAGPWSDLGHLDTATQIRTRMIGAREFNHLRIDEAKGLITKSSSKTAKIQQELSYYVHLPRDLAIYFPRLHDFHLGADVSYTLEFYSYRTLAEYFVFFSFPASVWQKIVSRLVAVHREFRSHAGPPPEPAVVFDFYLGKLLARMDDLPPNGSVRALVEMDQVTVNGQVLHGWRHYLPRIDAAIRRLAENTGTSIIHGDLCFSNILYDPQTGIIKLIDPRGSFFTEGCYGDPRYDLAKVLHSLHGGYDFIMQEMYDLRREDDGAYRFRLFRSPASEQMTQQLVGWLAAESGETTADLLVLEALLFLSMLPLHADDPERQKALYLTGITILREVFGADLH